MFFQFRFWFFITTVAISCSLIHCDYLLSIELNKFNNQFGTMMNEQQSTSTSSSHKCPQNKCLTYFKFCLLTNNEQTTPIGEHKQCLSKFVTQIIGENVIDQEQFQLTTNSIKFRLSRDLVNSESFRQDDADTKLFLLIQVLHYNEEGGDEEVNTSSAGDSSSTSSGNLISEWKLPIRLVKLNQWLQYEHSVNFKLKQVFLFNYMLNCADDYYGSKCDMPICTFDCDLMRGGYCNKPNECLCKSGWYGERCDKARLTTQWLLPPAEEKKEQACTLDCKNGGRCVLRANSQEDISSGAFPFEEECHCDRTLYDGVLCEIQIVSPHSCHVDMPCLNGASCLANGKCLCSPGYSGDRCQIKRLNSQCGHVTCYNGGTCFIDNQNEYTCLCHPLFTGQYCQIKLFSLVSTTTPKITTTETNSVTKPEITLTSTSESNDRHQPLAIPVPTTSLINEFSLNEIILILTISIGMPVFSILIVVILCRLNKATNSGEAVRDVQCQQKMSISSIDLNNHQLLFAGNKSNSAENANSGGGAGGFTKSAPTRAAENIYVKCTTPQWPMQQNNFHDIANYSNCYETADEYLNCYSSLSKIAESQSSRPSHCFNNNSSTPKKSNFYFSSIV